MLHHFANGPWTHCKASAQEGTSPLYPLPPSLNQSELYVRLYENASNATIQLVYRSLDDYFRALSKKMRSNVGRYARRLFEAGNVEIVSSSSSAALPGLLDVYRAVELLSWKDGIDGIVGRDPGRIGYFRGLMQPTNRCTSVFALSGYGYYKERWLARITPSNSVQVYRTGTLHHLKATLGEYKRHLLGDTDPQATAKRNLARETATDRRAAVVIGAADRQRADSTKLLAELQASGAHVDRLSHDELVDAMPFGVSGDVRAGATP